MVAARRRTTGLCASAIVLHAGLTACGSDRSTPAQAPPPAHPLEPTVLDTALATHDGPTPDERGVVASSDVAANRHPVRAH